MKRISVRLFAAAACIGASAPFAAKGVDEAVSPIFGVKIPPPGYNKVFGRAQSFVAGSPINLQLSVKDSRKYASTGGWGFGQFKDGQFR